MWRFTLVLYSVLSGAGCLLLKDEASTCLAPFHFEATGCFLGVTLISTPSSLVSFALKDGTPNLECWVLWHPSSLIFLPSVPLYTYFCTLPASLLRGPTHSFCCTFQVHYRCSVILWFQFCFFGCRTPLTPPVWWFCPERWDGPSGLGFRDTPGTSKFAFSRAFSSDHLWLIWGSLTCWHP